MTGTVALLGLRWRETVRTWRLWALPLVMVVLGVGSAATARFMNEIIGGVLSTDGVDFALPDPTAADAYAQWIKNISQLVVLVVVVMASAAINSEVRSGAAAVILVKPAGRPAYVLTHALALFAQAAVPAALGAGATWVATIAFFGPANAGPVAAATAVWLVLVAVLVPAALLASVTIDSVAAAAGVAIGAFIALVILGAFPALADDTPAGLIAVASNLAAGVAVSDSTLGWVLGSSLALGAALLTAAVAAFSRREI